MSLPQKGDTAPNFKIKNQSGEKVSLSDFKGSWVLLYFYPRDNTKGCTAEACGFRDLFSEYTKRGIKVLGVSADDEISHQKFIKKYDLPFELLADTEKEIVNKYGVWGKKKFMGREYMGINRVSFLINPEGVIHAVYENVKPADHPKEVLDDMEGEG